MINDHECRTFVKQMVDLLLIVYWLGDIIGSFLAISEVVLVISDVDLDNFLKFGKKFARHIPQNKIAELARLKKSLET